MTIRVLLNLLFNIKCVLYVLLSSFMNNYGCQRTVKYNGVKFVLMVLDGIMWFLCVHMSVRQERRICRYAVCVCAAPYDETSNERSKSHGSLETLYLSPECVLAAGQF